MKAHYLLLSLIATFSISSINPASAQNKVRNANIEEQRQAPSALSNLSCTNEWQPTNFGTPDYYATNSSNQVTDPARSDWTGVFVPHNYSANLYNGTLGLLTAQLYSGTNPVQTPEYLFQQLTQPLIGGRTYYASFWVLLAPNSPYATRLGLNVTAADPRSTSPITYSSAASGIISSQAITSRSWTRVSGIFPAEANAQYLNIGGLYSQGSSSVTAVPGAGIPNSPALQQQMSTISYYLIDDIEILEVPTAGPNPDVNSTSTITTPACSGVSVTIGQGTPIPDATYAWRNTANSNIVIATTPTTTVTPSTPTKYSLTVTLPSGEIYVSYVVVGCAPSISGPSIVCSGGTSPTYTASPAVSCNWTASPSSIFSTPTGYGGIFTPVIAPNANGIGTITATFSSYPGGARTVTYYVKVGRPAPPQVTITLPDPCPDNSKYFAITNFDPAFSYHITGSGISALPANLGAGSSSPNVSTFRMKGAAGVMGGTFTVTVTNACGTVTDGPFDADFHCQDGVTPGGIPYYQPAQSGPR